MVAINVWSSAERSKCRLLGRRSAKSFQIIWNTPQTEADACRAIVIGQSVWLWPPANLIGFWSKHGFQIWLLVQFLDNRTSHYFYLTGNTRFQLATTDPASLLQSCHKFSRAKNHYKMVFPQEKKKLIEIAPRWIINVPPGDGCLLGCLIVLFF